MGTPGVVCASLRTARSWSACVAANICSMARKVPAIAAAARAEDMSALPAAMSRSPPRPDPSGTMLSSRPMVPPGSKSSIRPPGPRNGSAGRADSLGRAGTGLAGDSVNRGSSARGSTRSMEAIEEPLIN